jgi:uncharacterized membrane protein YgcG
VTTVAIRIYTGIIALICTVAVTYALHSQNASAKWQKEVGHWQQLSDKALRHDRKMVRTVRKLTNRYNTLVARTRKSERALLEALRKMEAQSATVRTSSSGAGTVYTTVGSASASAGSSGGGSSSGGGGAVTAPPPQPVDNPPPPTTTAS